MVRPLAAVFGAAAFALVAISPSGARADDGTPSYASHEDTIHGRISEFDGQYDLKVRDDRGYVDSVHLHDGTVINPTGLRLASGLSVTILGHGNGSVFEANEIDTPYTEDPGPDAGPAFVDEGYATPAYGYYGYGCCYGYGYGGPYFGLAFGFGGGYYGGGYGYGHGGYGYNHGGYGYGRGGGYPYGHGYNPQSTGRRYLSSGGYGGGRSSYAGSGGSYGGRSSGGASSRGSFSSGGGRSSGGSSGHR